MPKSNRELGQVTAVAGAPQSGKSTWMRKQVEEADRVLVFGDWRGDYLAAGFTPLATPQEILTTLKGHKGEGRFTYRGEDFETWCWAAIRWGLYNPCTLIADELAYVTRPGKAPKEWGQLLRMAAGNGLFLYGCTQRPSESDTTIWGIADVLHCHRLVRADDADSLARELNCKPEDLLALPDYAWIERESRSAQFSSGGP